MTIDEAIARERQVAEKHRNDIVPKEDYHNMSWIDENNEVSMRSAEEHEQLAEWLEKLKTIENIMLIYNANWYADEDNGVPDSEVLESIWNVIQDNGLDIDIEQDYRKGKSDGYNKAIDDFANGISEYLGVENATKYGNKNAEQQRISYDTLMKYEIADAIDDIAEQLKAGGENEYNI